MNSHIAVNKISAFDYDGRMRTIYTVSGTETGRSSTKIPSPPVRPSKSACSSMRSLACGTMEQSWDAILRTKDMSLWKRTCLRPKLVLLRYLATTVNSLNCLPPKPISITLAAIIFGVQVGAITPELRFIGKTCRE